MSNFTTLFANALINAGVRLVTGYPGYPVSGLLTQLSNAFEAQGIFKWTVNERIALEMCMGASFSGVRTAAVIKSHGMNTVVDQLVNFAYLGVCGGTLLIVGDDIQVRASQNRTDSRAYGPLTGVPVFEPATPVDVADHLRRIFEFSEKWDTPVLFRFSEQILDMSSDVLPEKVQLVSPPGKFMRNTDKYLLGPINFHHKKRAMQNRLSALSEQPRCSFNTLELRSREKGIIVSGTLYNAVRADFPDASIYKAVLSYPICMAEVNRLVDHLRTKVIHIAELMDGVIRTQVLQWCAERGIQVKDAFRETKPFSDDPPTDSSLCPACPHRGVLIALKELNLDVMGDAGCSALGYFQPFQAVHCQAAMGASIGMACGVNSVVSRKAVALIGDAAFYHGGLNALLQAADGPIDLLTIILDNRIAAMTGGQPSIGQGRDNVPGSFKLPMLCTACGISADNIVETDRVFDVHQLRRLISALYAKPGVKVLIVHGRCIHRRNKPEGWQAMAEAKNERNRKAPETNRLPYARHCPAYMQQPAAKNRKLSGTACGPCRICYPPEVKSTSVGVDPDTADQPLNTET